MKIYTKNGDNGMSTLMNRTLISKADDRFEALGTLDELNSHLGLVKCISSLVEQEKLTKIQRTLMVLMSGIADPGNTEYRIGEAEIARLESEIDLLESSFPRLKDFVLPGGCEKSARLDVARTVTRRAERRLISLSKRYGIHTNSIQYLNRLSDYLYVFARRCDYEEEQKKNEEEQKNTEMNLDELTAIIEAEVRRWLKS